MLNRLSSAMISHIGSQNIDHRSFYLSTESAVVIYSKQFRDALNEKFDLIIADSLLVNSDGEYEVNDNVEVAPLKRVRRSFDFVVLVKFFI